MDQIEYASTLPSRYYLEPSILDAEHRQIFARTWQLASDGADLTQAGAYCETTIAGEPIAIVRGADGEQRAMSNVCRHRAGPVVKGSGVRKSLQCGYHGWTYSLDGRLLTTPEMDGIRDFDRESCRLPQFRLETLIGLPFVNVDGQAPPLAEVMGEIATMLSGRDFTGFRFAARKNWELDCNWKVYVDNYLEGYHIPIVHPSLFRELDYPNYRTETKRYYSIQHAPVRRTEKLRGDDEVRYFWVFPNLMLNVYADNFSTNLVLPLGPERTLTVFAWYFRDPAAATQQVADTIAFSDEIQIEDIEICEAVQRGLRSSTYDTGRYSPSRENGVHHFHALYRDHMKI